jgi:hypothetical protein
VRIHGEASLYCPFGYRPDQVDDVAMEDNRNNVYVPFVELPIEVHFFYWLGATCALYELGSWSPTTEEFTAALACIWDGEQFSIADAVDFLRMSKRLIPLLAKFAPRRELPIFRTRRARRIHRA